MKKKIETAGTFEHSMKRLEEIVEKLESGSVSLDNAMELYEEGVKKLFDEDDLLFLRYLLIEKAGLNLRNKVAHSLMAIHDYNAGSMHLVMLALLRLAKYNFVAKVGKEAEAQDGKSPKP